MLYLNYLSYEISVDSGNRGYHRILSIVDRLSGHTVLSISLRIVDSFIFVNILPLDDQSTTYYGSPLYIKISDSKISFLSMTNLISYRPIANITDKIYKPSNAMLDIFLGWYYKELKEHPLTPVSSGAVRVAPLGQPQIS